MSATYNPLLPTDLDKARALLGDTVVEPAADALLSDEHILAVLAMEGSFALGLAWLADELVAQFAQEPVKVSISGVSVDYSARITAWQTLATRMRTKAAEAATAAAPTAISFIPARYGAAEASDEYAR